MPGSSTPSAPLLERLTLRRVVSVLAASALLIAVVAPASVTAAARTSQGHQAKARITKVGQTHLAKTAAKPVAEGDGANLETGPREPDEELDAKVGGSQSAKRVPAAHVPTPAGLAVTGAAGATGWDGQSHFDQRFSGTGIYAGTNFSTEPPDMGLCVGNGFVVQGVNSSLRVYSASGAPLTAATPLNQLYGLAPQVNRNAGVAEPYGDDVGDVKCYFDPDTQRFFVSAFRLPLDPVTGAFPSDESHVVLAVSATADPTGAWNVYDLDTTDGDGSLANHAGCPCLADQPLIGADHYGFYISTNEYSLEPFGAVFNGAQVYAFNKAQLAAGAGGSLTGVHFDGLTLADGTAYTLQPATTPAGGAYELGQGGTEYFLSALDFNATLDNRIAVWGLTGTSTLGSATPAVRLTSRVLDSEVYGQPPDAEQKDGPTPLRDAEAAGLEGVKSVEHLELLAGNDDRMQEVKYAAGTLWGDVNTVVKNANGDVNVGIAWFAVAPSISSTGVSGSIAHQGYVAVNRANAMYGAIAANNRGDAAMGFTLSGTSYYPSAAWVSLTGGASSAVHVSAAGQAPEDGFTGYVIEGGSGTSRWGDYHAATADEAGNLWMSVEFIPAVTPEHPRSLFANWGTHITKVAP